MTFYHKKKKKIVGGKSNSRSINRNSEENDCAWAFSNRDFSSLDDCLTKFSTAGTPPWLLFRAPKRPDPKPAPSL
ncbi:hypothetical protein C1H46_045757 [Malus baccata]|uniref:Uncharacterized protein n=1 Tax=Malus baccata TaxID=106549 RepID=A0A540K3B0_MALBA|nr:hypothetical protein C1H46_045757 [Malus baccata]